MNNMPEFVVQAFSSTQEEFLAQARTFYESNAKYRGYDEMLELIGSKDLSQYRLFEITSDNVCAGVAAARMSGEVVFLEVFIVDEQFRAIGVGDALFDEIMNNEEFKTAKFYESMALPGDRSTKNFFEQRKGKARLLIIKGDLNRS